MSKLSFPRPRRALAWVGAVTPWLQTAAQDAESAVAGVHLEALPLGQTAATPWAFSPAWFLLIALGVPALAWAGCAWKRALDEDPHRLRRRGRRELRRLLQQMGRANATAPGVVSLHGWMRASARTWGVPMAAPTPQQIANAVAAHGADDAQHANWRELWGASETALFAADAQPPQGWLQRASSAAAGVQIPKRERWLPNRRRHWLPMLVGLVTAALMAPMQDAQAQATLASDVALPDAPDLGPAREAAEEAALRNWNDWAAHHNIAAWHMQQQRWNAAVAHGTAAFLQHPSSGAGRDNLRFALTQVQNPDPALRMLLSGTLLQRSAAWLSPAQWQRVALISSLLLAAALAAAILRLYAHLPRHQAWQYGIHGGIALGALSLVASLHGWNGYGRLAHPDAAILVLQAEVAPEPSDLAPREEFTPAGAGTIVRQQRAFLTWRRVQMRDDVGGWVRADQLLPFYSGGISAP